MSKSLFEQIVDEVFADQLFKDSDDKPGHPGKIPKPAVNIVDYDDRSEIWINVAGYDSNMISLELSTERDSLELIINNINASVTNIKKIIHREFHTPKNLSGITRRKIQITRPEEYDLDKIVSDLSLGVLTVTMPKKKPETLKPTQIKIR